MKDLEHFDRFKNINTEIDHTQELQLYHQNKEFGMLYLNLLASKSTDNLTKMLQYFAPDATYSNPLLEDITLREFYCFMYIFLISVKEYDYKYEFVNSNDKKVRMRSLLTYINLENQEIQLLLETTLYIENGKIKHIEDEFSVENWLEQKYKYGKYLSKLPSFQKKKARELELKVKGIASAQ